MRRRFNPLPNFDWLDSLQIETTKKSKEEDQKQASSEEVFTTDLSKLPEKMLLDESALAKILGVTKRTVRRMVNRFELPPPVRLRGKSTWFAGRVLRYIEDRAERLQRDAERRERKISEHSP